MKYLSGAVGENKSRDIDDSDMFGNIELPVEEKIVFNKFDSDCKTQTFGHEFGGVSSGGMCEQSQGKGYTVVVDQVSRGCLVITMQSKVV